MSDGAVKQEVNLLDQGFRPKVVPLSAQLLITVTAAVILVLMVFYVIAKSQIPRLQEQMAQLDKEYTTQQNRLDQLSARLGQEQDTARLDSEIEKLSKEKKTKSDVVNLLSGKSLGNTTGFSSYIEGLARQIESGLWLRRITISNGGSDLSITGSTLDPRLVPVYLQRLSKESAFAGTEFKTFEMQRRKKEPAKIDFVVKTSAESG